MVISDLHTFVWNVKTCLIIKQFDHTCPSFIISNKTSYFSISKPNRHLFNKICYNLSFPLWEQTASRAWQWKMSINLWIRLETCQKMFSADEKKDLIENCAKIDSRRREARKTNENLLLVDINNWNQITFA